MKHRDICVVSLSFMLGILTGAFMMYNRLSQKFEERFQDEIDSVRKVYKKEADGRIEKSDSVEKAEVERYFEEELNAVNRIIEKENYHSSDDKERPYVISPDEFGEFDDYETISLTYYQDGTLADDNDQVIDDVNDIIGNDSLTHFGEYEDDSVFVRNDKMKCDYEILYDRRSYQGILNSKPYLAEGL